MNVLSMFFHMPLSQCVPIPQDDLNSTSILSHIVWRTQFDFMYISCRAHILKPSTNTLPLLQNNLGAVVTSIDMRAE